MDSSNQDPLWDSAWAWVVRQHEPQGLDAVGRADLARWLDEAPQHRATYEKAAQLWLLTGLVPPVNDVDGPGSAASRDLD